MCFSAQASFIAAAGLSAVGIASLYKARTSKLRLLASAPLFFGIQQACEGVVWLTLLQGDTTSSLHKMAVYGFLFFAGIFWPLWVPDTLFYLEKIRRRKIALALSCTCGTLFALTALYQLIKFGATASIAHHHITYNAALPNNFFPGTSPEFVLYFWLLIYVLGVVLPFFVSSLRYMWLLGLIIAIGLGVSLSFFYLSFGSIWCFFAAIASILIYVIV